jgi:hypothetical protein
MKGFIFGIVTMILILGLALVFTLMGFVSMRADNPPSRLETTIAGQPWTPASHALPSN